MNGNAVSLRLEGLPNYRLYEDGDILNIKTGKILKSHGPKCRNLQLWDHNKPHNVCVPILLRRYFDSELNRIPKEYVANLGFMGFSNYYVAFFGKVWTKKHEQWLVNSVSHNGYINVTMIDDTDRKRTVAVHTLVARAFVPNPNNYDQIDHIDGNKENNIATNLEWVSGVENARRARSKGLKPQAITDEEVHIACQMILDGKSDSEIGQYVHASSALINAIRHGHIHCEISSQYGIEEDRIHNRAIDYSKYKKNAANYKHYKPKEKFNYD